MSLRTDLAMESAQQIALKKNINGVNQNISVFEEAAAEITDITVETDSAAVLLGKPKGRYITIKFTEQMDSFSDSFEKRVDIIAEQIKKFSPSAEKILAVGLGNRNITPDALGPMCADRIFASRHIKKLAAEIDSEGLAELSVIQTGVMGQTGIEASEQVKALCKNISPELVVAIDALACSDFSNLGNTIQLCNTGISPGSGVENSRKELSEQSLGIKCIAIGVPTVVDMTTAAEQITGAEAENEYQNMMVTPRNIDSLIMNASKYIAYAVNRAFHRSLSLSDIQSLVE